MKENILYIKKKYEPVMKQQHEKMVKAEEKLQKLMMMAELRTVKTMKSIHKKLKKKYIIYIMDSLRKINKLIDIAERRKKKSRSKSPKSKVDDLIRMTERRKEQLEDGRRRARTEISKIDSLIRLAEQRKREFRKNYDYNKRIFPEIHRSNVPIYAPVRKSSSPKMHRIKQKIKIYNDPYDIHKSNVTRKYLEHLKHKTRRSR
jgi:hypothetical protein